MTTRSLQSTRLVLALLAAGAIGGASVTALQHMSAAHAAAPATVSANAPVANPAPAGASVPMALPDFSQITAQYGPAVVNISVTGSRKGGAGDSPVAQRGRGDDPFGNDPFFEFFRRYQQGPGGPQRDTPVRSQGSGFIWASRVLRVSECLVNVRYLSARLTAMVELKHASSLGAFTSSP